jgi:hypothetical protein
MVSSKALQSAIPFHKELRLSLYSFPVYQKKLNLISKEKKKIHLQPVFPTQRFEKSKMRRQHLFSKKKKNLCRRQRHLTKDVADDDKFSIERPDGSTQGFIPITRHARVVRQRCSSQSSACVFHPSLSP